MGFEPAIMLFPGSDRIILVNTGGKENVFPQFLHCFFFWHPREGRFSPGWASNGNNTPLHFVLHGVFHGAFACHTSNLLPLGNPCWIRGFEQVRIRRNDAENMVVVQEKFFGKIHQVFRVGFKAFRGSFQKAVKSN